jgi:histidine triad (HIT) family protein
VRKLNAKTSKLVKIRDCIFCEIINENREKEQVVFENEEFIVLTDKFRKTSVGSICLIIPKKHKKNILELTETDGKQIIPVINIVSKAMQKAYDCNGIRIWTAVNKEAGQSIFHCHIHVLPCNSVKDRIIADFPGIYDLKKRILGKRELSESVNFKLAEKMRNEIKILERI